MYEIPFNKVIHVSAINTSHDQHFSFLKSHYISQAKEQIYKYRYNVTDVLSVTEVIKIIILTIAAATYLPHY